MEKVGDAAMRMMTQIALERAFQICSEKAKWAAEVCPDGISGRDALLTFSETILSTNASVWPTGGEV